MSYEIKQIRKKTSYNALSDIGAGLRPIRVYKYMDVETARLCLENNNLRFCIPSAWKDPYEKRFYQADYRHVDKSGFEKKLFAYCVTQKRTSEAAWRMYTDDPKKTCVKFSICVGQFQYYLDRYAYHNYASLYRGKVFYDFQDDELNGLHLKSSEYHKIFFENFNLTKYLNLMLLKRKAFDYEGEMRYMIMDDKFDFEKDYLYIPMPWSLCLDKVFIPKEITTENREKIENALKRNYQICKDSYPNSYVFHISTETEDLFHQFKNISIEGI